MSFVRDPLWQNIRIDPLARRLMDTAVMQRLRYVRQLGLAHLVYPGATHSRFEHALGAYHLARRTLHALREAGTLGAVGGDEPTIVAVAALLHDVGHYPFSHALEEIGAPHHEGLAKPLICEGDVGDLLRAEVGADAPQRIHALVRGESESPLQGLISGSLDLDKMDYLKRDAFMCGVPYGEIDEERLLHALVLVDEPGSGKRRVGLLSKGLAALESLLFAKYQMYRNVYWHHAVRSATAMYKRIVERALAGGTLDPDALVGYTDEGLLHALDAPGRGGGDPMLAALRQRRLFKRAFEAPAAELPMERLEWIAEERPRANAAEAALAKRLGLEASEVLLDFPAKTQMLGLDLLVLGRDGAVSRLTQHGVPGVINLPRLAEEFYRSARYLRVFTARRVDATEAVRRELLS